MAPPRGNYFRARVVQEREGNKAKGGEGVAETKVTSFRGKFFCQPVTEETVYPAIFVVVARDDADAQSFSRAPFSNSAYQSGNLLPSLLY